MYFEYLRAGKLEVVDMPGFAEQLRPYLEREKRETVTNNIVQETPAFDEVVLLDEVEGVTIEHLGDKCIINVHMPMSADTVSLNFELPGGARLAYFTVAAQCKTSATGKINPASGYVEEIEGAEGSAGKVRVNLFGKKNNSVDALIVLYLA
ncbi:hypothetical protein BNJ_00371 [Kaumoebavirus]|uniref:hypothetical protein n=1 Tax=Kaumoebavirus TaxID=1859492 RepID=UPI0009C1E71A|nr:hypothetical protein BNJ_00371 [Kaumoebavirus]ARA72191.1 hypothetical protein BNJ_00371 [Kaumoebavirus]